MFAFLKNRRRRKLLAQPWPDPWRQIIEENVPVAGLLSPPQRQRLQEAVRIIVAERQFVGCSGLSMTDEVKVTIAAQAALLLLGEEGYFFDRVPTIFVYPRWPKGKIRHGLQASLLSEPLALVEEDVPLDGQVIEQGEIRLSWEEVLYGGRDPADGENVVLHEFAHHLDSLDGELGGLPPLASSSQRRRWLETFDRELDQLRADLNAGRQPFLYEEAAESRAELFAYSTEIFFEQPGELAELHPELFECLRAFYKLDPRQWFSGHGVTA